MRYYLNLIRQFIQASFQQELAYRSNFLIGLLHSLLSLGTGVLSLAVLFEQVESIQGWEFAATLAVLGVFMTVGALQNLFISPSLESLAGIGGDVLSGQLDFTLLRPVNKQFLVSFRRWQPFALIDLALGLGVLVVAITRMGSSVTSTGLITFVVLLASGMVVLYAILLAFTAMVFWSPGFLFTWVFSGVFQMARYPLGLYPGWLRLVLTWIIPVGLITTVPVQALTGDLEPAMLGGSLALAAGLLIAASWLFRVGLQRYASASS
ncbi:MAG: hypothetical protein GXY36_12595 [Chloroflexi bacterium]|nr:hypothetical protein [Chloroflexota bacterium]